MSYQHLNKERKKVTKKERNHYYYFCKLFSGRDKWRRKEFFHQPSTLVHQTSNLSHGAAL